MPTEIVLPRLGWNMETGSVGQWLKGDGDDVRAGEIIFTVEGDKAVQEVEALDSGILRILPDSPPPGTEVPVGTLLAYLLQPGEAVPVATTLATHARPGAPLPAAVAASQAAGADARRLPISPRARRVAQELAVDWTQIRGSGRSGRIVERDVRQRSAQMAQPTAAMRHGFTEAQQAAPLRAAPNTAAQVTLTTEADATELVRLRTQLERGGILPVPSYDAFFVKLVARALTEHPSMNARLDGNALVPCEMVNVGVAIGSEHGLLAPAVHGAQARSLRQIALALAALTERARAGALSPHDLRSGTFTIVNLGMYEVDAFTPLVHAPECAVLGLGRIVARQVVVSAETGKVAIRHMMALSLTFDQRLGDVTAAARFLQRVKHDVEQPYVWLLG